MCVKAGGAKGIVQLADGAILAARTQHKNGQSAVACFRSRDQGATWQELSLITQAAGDWDLGDGHLIQLKSGDVLYSYRHNKTRVSSGQAQTYSIRIAQSSDGGQSWRPHSVVAESAARPGAEADHCGLWSSFLLLKQDGALLCFYDDEASPQREGFRNHQWLTQKTWDPARKTWQQPVTVSRTDRRTLLARDGMASVVELSPGQLLAAFESVQTEKPHANLIRYVTSRDGGKSWDWPNNGRHVLYEPPDRRYLAISPWLARAGNGALFCVFATDENQPAPEKSGTPPPELHSDIKYVVSRDAGKTWDRPAYPIFSDSHRTYAPGVVALNDGSLLVTFMDFSLHSTRAWRGDFMPK